MNVDVLTFIMLSWLVPFDRFSVCVAALIKVVFFFVKQNILIFIDDNGGCPRYSTWLIYIEKVFHFVYIEGVTTVITLISFTLITLIISGQISWGQWLNWPRAVDKSTQDSGQINWFQWLNQLRVVDESTKVVINKQE